MKPYVNPGLVSGNQQDLGHFYLHAESAELGPSAGQIAPVYGSTSTPVESEIQPESDESLY